MDKIYHHRLPMPREPRMDKEVRDFCRPLTAEEILYMIREERRGKDRIDRLIRLR